MEPIAPPAALDEPRRVGRKGVTLIALTALVLGLGLGVIFTLFYRLTPEGEEQASSFFRDFAPARVLESAASKGGISNVSWKVSEQGGGSPWFGNRRQLHAKHYLAEAEMAVNDQANLPSYIQQAVYDLMSRQGVANISSGGGSSSTSGGDGDASSIRHNRHFHYQSGGKAGNLQIWMFGQNKKVTIIFSVAEN